MKRIIAIFSTVLALSAAFVFSAAPALAQNGWNWTDISDKIAERLNRPAWAMAYASPYWYFTDGQDLSTGGHVWKTEGTALADITTDVRNAGISRVDDIVGDGQTVIFLKDVTKGNNSFQAVAYNGTFSNPTSYWKSVLNTNEGLVSVMGNNGLWMLLTTSGRVFEWNAGSNSVINITLPGTNTVNGTYAYSMRHTSPADQTGYFLKAVVPLGNDWLFALPGSNTQTPSVSFYKYSGGTFFDITGTIPQTNYLQAIASNGSQVLIAGGTNANATDKVYLYDGTTSKNLTSAASGLPFSSWSHVIAGYDGTSWLIVSGKNLARFDGTNFQSLGTTRDLFLNLAGNGNGTFLVGGAVSDFNQNDPTNPLTLKLAKAVEENLVTNVNPGNTATNNTGTFGGGRTYSSTSGPNVTTAGSPSSYSIASGQNFGFQVTASDPNGINRISIYADGSLAKTCYSSYCEYDNVYSGNGLSTRSVPFYASVLDQFGYRTDTSVETLTVGQGTSQTTSVTQQDAASGIYYWTSFNPNQTILSRGSTMTYNVGASDSNGIQSIQIVVNGAVRQTCNLGNASGNQTCYLTLSGTDYLAGSQLAINAEITDGSGKQAWTPLNYLSVVDSSSSNSSDISVWDWMDPTGTTLSRGSSATLRVQANATQGLTRIDVYVNGSIQRTCNFSQTTVTQSCDATIYGSSFSSNTQLTLNARATDYFGRTTWSNNQYVTVQDNGSSGSGSVWATSYTDLSNSATLSRTANTTLHVQGASNSGLSRIDVYVNGSIQRTCNFSQAYGTQSCDTVIYGSNYSNGTQLSLDAKSTDYYGNTAWSSLTYLTVQDNGSSGSGSVWATSYTDLSNSATLSRTSNTTLHVQAASNSGLSRIDVYVNGTIMRTCNFSQVYGTQNCDAIVYGSNYSNGTQLSLDAKATDYYGNTAWSSLTYLTVQDNGSSGSGNVVASNWLDSGITTLNRTSNTVMHVQASAGQGLSRIDVYVNGSIQRTCNFSQIYGTQNCDTTIYGSNYSNGTQLSLDAKATDYYGNASWSNLINLTVQDNGSSGSGSVWASSWTDLGNYATLYNGNNTTLHVQGASNVGLSRIDVYVNGSIQRSCNFSQAYGTQSCDLYLYGSNYSNGSQLAMNAKSTDYSGNTAWSSLTYLTVQGSSGSTYNGSTNNNPSVWEWSEPNNASQILPGNSVKYYAGAWDNNGLQSITMYVNGLQSYTCTFGGYAYGNQQCAVTISAGSYNANDQVFVNAKATDSSGNSTWTNGRTFTVQATSGSTATGTTNNQGTITMQSTADNGFSATDNITFTATGSDPDGVQRIELYVNAELVKTCYGNTTCSWTGGPYATRSSLTYGARLYDNLNFSSWTGYKTIYKK